MAATGSSLVIGYEVEINPRLEKVLLSSGVEVRLYKVIYRLIDDLKMIAKDVKSFFARTLRIKIIREVNSEGLGFQGGSSWRSSMSTCSPAINSPTSFVPFERVRVPLPWYAPFFQWPSYFLPETHLKTPLPSGLPSLT